MLMSEYAFVASYNPTRALIVLPARDLATQLREVFKALNKGTILKVCSARTVSNRRKYKGIRQRYNTFASDADRSTFLAIEGIHQS